jgi:hypothetical protein
MPEAAAAVEIVCVVPAFASVPSLGSGGSGGIGTTAGRGWPAGTAVCAERLVEANKTAVPISAARLRARA